MNGQDNLTYSLWASSNLLLLGFEGTGVAVYEIVDGQLLEIVSPQTSDTLYAYYEVSTTGDGSWWIPTSTNPPDSWGDTTSLEATGNIETANILRPQSQFWWIPAEVQDEENLGSIMQLTRGKVLGNFPQGNPKSASVQPEKPTTCVTTPSLEKNPQGGTKITLHKQHLPLLIDIANKKS
jgi:hypothetical protein